MSLSVDTITNEAGDGPVDLSYQSAARAYVHTDGSANSNNALNVSSVADTGTGINTVSFTNAFSDALYVPVLGVERSSGARFIDFETQAAGSVVLKVFSTGSAEDDADQSMVVHGDLA